MKAGLAAESASCRSKRVGLYLYKYIYHDGGDWNKSIVHSRSLGDIVSLEGDLQATVAHSESHGIHPDVRSVLARFSGVCTVNVVHLKS